MDWLTEDNVQDLGLLDGKLEMLARMRADNVPAQKLAAALDRLEEQQAILLGVLTAQQSGQDPGVGALTQAWVERKIDEVEAEIGALQVHLLAHNPTDADHELALALQAQWNAPSAPSAPAAPKTVGRLRVWPRCPSEFSDVEQLCSVEALPALPDLPPAQSVRRVVRDHPGAALPGALITWVQTHDNTPPERYRVVQALGALAANGRLIPAHALFCIELARSTAIIPRQLETLASVLQGSAWAAERAKIIAAAALLRRAPYAWRPGVGLLAPHLLEASLQHGVVADQAWFEEAAAAWLARLPAEAAAWINSLN